MTNVIIQAKGFFFKPSLKNKTTVFSVGTRGDVLGQVHNMKTDADSGANFHFVQELEAPIIVPHSQQKTEQKYPFEMLFRSIQVYFFLSTRFALNFLQYAMVDNACREFLFVSEFFILDATSALEIFNNIFGKTVQLLVKHTDSHISDSFDCISIFLCIDLVQVNNSTARF